MIKFFIPKNENDQKGNALLIVMVLFVVIALSIATGLVTPIIRANRVATNNLQSKRSYFVAESGVEDVFYRLLSSKKVASTENLVLGDQTALTNVTDIIGGGKQIQSVGDAEDRNRTIAVTLTEGAGVSFNYGVQVGQGGIELSGSSGINGSVYANGDIQGTSSSFIHGSAIAASSPLQAEQSNDAGTLTNLNFGNNSTKRDLAQSFQVSTSDHLNKVQFFLKKVGSPSNGTVYIVSDNAGKPSSTVITQAPLSSSLVGTTAGWVEAIFTTSPVLQTATTYWFVIQVSSSSSNYYVSGSNNNGYASGIAKIGKKGGSWYSVSPVDQDIYFKLYVGGQGGHIFGSSLSQWNQFPIGTGANDSVSAINVDYVKATGKIYCQSGSGNNKSCDPLPTAPSEQAWPISESNIASWKDEALAGGTISGDQSYGGSSSQSLGPKKIVGNLSLGNSAVLSLTGTLWVTGDLTINGASKLKLSSAYGSGSGVVIVDGKVIIAGSSPVTGSGTTGSYIMLVSLSDCPESLSCNGNNAIDISGAAGAVVLVAQNGTIEFSGSASAKQATGYKMVLSGATTVNYESGLANMNFSSGPSGSWNVKSWRETQ